MKRGTAIIAVGAGAISAKVFVGNLNYRTTKEELIAFFAPAGEVVDAYLPTDRETGRPRGFGFVTFASPEQAAKCVEEFNGADFNGRRLNINAAEERGRGPRPGGGGGRAGASGPRSGPSRGRASPIQEFKRGSRRDGGGEERGRRPSGPPRSVRPSGPPMHAPSLEEALEPTFDTADRQYVEDASETIETDEWGDSPDWQKKKKRQKGSRRGLRAKKRDI